MALSPPFLSPTPEDFCWFFAHSVMVTACDSLFVPLSTPPSHPAPQFLPIHALDCSPQLLGGPPQIPLAQQELGGRRTGVPFSPHPVPATISLLLCSLYTCVLEAPVGHEARKWLQLAVFCSPLAPGQSHLQLRVYFLNNTPCALQWALTNEQPHGGRLRGPCQLFDFTGARGDQCLKLKYISEGEGGGGPRDRAIGSTTRGRGLGVPLG